MTDITSTDPKPVQELHRTIAPLTDERRLEAQERARALVVKAAGDMPKAKDFSQHTEGKYPPWMNGLINTLCLVVLLSAFAPSAIRLYAIGSTTFAESIPHETSANVAGLSIVIMAELSMVLFSIASVVIEAKAADVKTITDSKTGETKTIDPNKSVKRLLAFSQFIATVIALVGNGQVSLPGHEYNLFAWIEAFTPSIVVFTTATILKAQLLNAMERRHANTRAYQMALNAWKTATAHTESDPRYQPALNNALRDFLREDNGKGAGATARKEYMAGLVLVDWQRLVKRERMADEWYADPDASAVSAVPVHVKPVHSVRSFAVNERMNGHSNGNHEFIQPVHSVNERAPVNGEFVHSERSVNSANGYTKRMDAKTVARLFFEQHPEHMNTRLDDLVPIIEAEMGVKVGRTSVHNARKEMGS
jgi:hypothetical protein